MFFWRIPLQRILLQVRQMTLPYFWRVWSLNFQESFSASLQLINFKDICLRHWRAMAMLVLLVTSSSFLHWNLLGCLQETMRGMYMHWRHSWSCSGKVPKLFFQSVLCIGPIWDQISRERQAMQQLQVWDSYRWPRDCAVRHSEAAKL